MTSRYKIKIIIIGENEEFKSGFLRLLATSTFNREFKSVLGVNLGTAQYTHKETDLIFSIWDCLCSSRTDFCRKGFYKGADTLVIIHEMGKDESSNGYEKEVKTQCGDLPTLHLYVNGSEQGDEVEIEDGMEIYHDLDDIMGWFGDQIINRPETKPKKKILISETVFPEPIQITDTSMLRSHPELLIPILEYMGFKISEENDITIMTEHALYSVNLNTTDITVVPLICETCSRKCKRETDQRLCIVSAGVGWSNMADLSQKDFLFLSKIYTLANLSFEELPRNVQSQLGSVLFCDKFKSEKEKKN